MDEISEEERIEKEIGITVGDTWAFVIVRVLLWLEKKFAEKKHE